MVELFRKNQQNVYQALPLLEIDWLEHGFGTSLSVEWNQQAGLVTLSQVHSDICLYAPAGAGRLGRGDALMTDVAGVRLGVRTADCVPVLLVDARRRAVAAIHAGWRGTAEAISRKAVQALGERFGSSPADLVAAIGPGIGPCCYEVGEEVAIRFREWFPERDDLGRRARIDLPEANRRQLALAGLSESRVHVASLCTCCSGDEFHSWRREGQTTARMVNAIRIL